MSLGTWLCDHGRHRWRPKLVEFPAETPEQANADGIYHPYEFSRWLSVCRRCGSRKPSSWETFVPEENYD